MYGKNKAHYIVSTAIILKDGKYLIAKRSPDEKAMPNEWTVPGGKLEMNDYTKRKKDTKHHWYNVLEDLTRREVLEEVGVKIKNIRYLTSMVYIRPDKIPCLIISLYADWASGKVKLCDALTEFAWVNLRESKKYKLIEGIYEELEMLDKVLKGKKITKWRKKK